MPRPTRPKAKSGPIQSPYSSQKQAPAPEPKASSPARPSRASQSTPGQKFRQKTGEKFGTKAGPTGSPRESVARPATIQSKNSTPGARVTRRASESLRNGHLWVYASDVESLTESNSSTGTPALIPVADNRGILLGTALYSPASQIALRLVSRELLTQPQWLALLDKRLRTAIRRRLPLLDAGTNACRLVFSEADDLPGVIVDKYADISILQLLAKGLDNAETREVCAHAIAEELFAIEPALTLWERPDPRIRELEGLSAPSGEPLFASGAPAESTVFRLNGLSFHSDASAGQKTGAFLDQRQNYAAAAAWAKARKAQKALDVCTYQGGFAMHLAQVCRQVTGIDSSRASLEVAERNLALNRSQIAGEVDWMEADAFELLRNWSESKDTSDWDLIVLDPPAFAKSKRAIEGALRGYKELNLRALKMLKPGGLLFTCSCSHHVSLSDLEAVVASAANDAHRRVTLLERRGAAQDHPVLLNLPETEYLKCLVCQVD